jgi:hypothetical protein
MGCSEKAILGAEFAIVDLWSAGGKPQDASFIKSVRRGKRADFERLKIVVALPFAAHN